ncbi:acyl-CoA dehydrogenase family protein [Microcoleus sp. FACHB-68]|uniref:acyl-CoA dehydrogenase family protein n=1 Tax=Microcoleus sp. FACHB-68 TaxID=2692826 RepID=UPI001684F352|nr:acyl-CoA dehydrogenase family protein [Microcoleus sp. FACHB-68]MBD1936227.1 acyl-CoA/acyl-ACP dehydrogenase [Microcoleus sp. FACHB-68]
MIAISKTKNPFSFETILESTREIAHEVVAIETIKVDQDACWPEQGIRAMQAAGLGGLVIPKAKGGLGQGLLALTQVCELLGGECASTALCFGMHSVGAAVLAAKATPYQQERYVEPICEGKHLTTLALSEPGSGAHFYLPQCQLTVESPAMFRVNGQKSFITNGGYADSYVISTTAADANAVGEFSCAMISNGAEGLIWGAPWAGLGMRGNSSRSAELRNVPVPRQDLLGTEGDQIWYVFNVVAPYFLVAMAGTYLGVASAALEEARIHLSKRYYTHSGSTLGQTAVMQHRLGTLWSVVERTRRLIYYAATEADSGGPNTLPALCSAKAEVADCAVNVVNEVMTITGGINYRDGSKLERLLRDARAAHVMSPTTDILRTWAGRALLGLPLLGD